MSTLFIKIRSGCICGMNCYFAAYYCMTKVVSDFNVFSIRTSDFVQMFNGLILYSKLDYDVN